MSSPDFSKYVDLSIYDTDAETILNEIITYARGLIPEWSPLAGEVEVVLAEAIASNSANLAAYINRLPNATAEILMRLFNVTRSDGAKATGTVEFTPVDNGSYQIPVGTAVAYISANSLSYVYKTTTLVNLSGGSPASATVEASAVGSAYNTPPNGSTVALISNANFVASAAFTATGGPTGGEDAENDTAFFNRASNLFATYSSALVTPSQITSTILAENVTNVYRAITFDQRRIKDRDTTAASYTTHPGFFLTIVGGENADQSDYSDITLSAEVLADIKNSIQPKVPTGVIMDIATPTIVTVDVSVSAVAASGFDSGVVSSSIQTALDQYLDPNVWNMSAQYVRVNELISMIDRVAGVDHVVSVTVVGSPVESGVADGSTSDVLLQETGQNFTSTVVIGQQVNVDGKGYAFVDSVDSDTQLTISGGTLTGFTANDIYTITEATLVNDSVGVQLRDLGTLVGSGNHLVTVT